MFVEPGDKYVTLQTPRNEKNAVPADADCWVAFVDGLAISVYVPLPDGWALELRVPRPLFGMNFRQAPFAPRNPGYAVTRHYSTGYA